MDSITHYDEGQCNRWRGAGFVIVTDLTTLPAILTPAEAAALLRLAKKTFEGLVQGGEATGRVQAAGQKEWQVVGDSLLAWMRKGGEGQTGYNVA